MIIQHNIQAMNSSRMLGITTGLQAKSTEKLASGYRINRAADDAAGLAISEKMRKKIRGLNRGQDNTMDGISFVQVGDGAMGQVADMIQRMNVLAVQAANGTNSASDREAIQGEVSHLKKEIDRINETTKFNEMNVFLQDEPNIAEVELSVTGKPDTHDDLNFFRDDNGNAAGIIFHGYRVKWEDIDADLYDAKTNTFHKGDEDVGNYELHYHGMVLGLNFISCESRGDEINAVNYGGTKSIIYEWHEQPDGTESDVAVDVAGGGTLTVDDENGYNKKSMLSKFGAEAKFTVRADDTGVWLTHNGSEVTGSKKAWKDLVTISASTSTDPDNRVTPLNGENTGGIDDEEKAITISAARDVSVDAPNVTADFAASSSGKYAKAGGKYMDETEYSSNRKSTYDTAYNNKKSALTSSDQAVRQADSDYNTCQKARTDAEAAERTKLINGLSADEKTAYDNARAAGKSDDEALQAAGVSISSIASQGETAYQAAVKTAAEKAGTNAL